MTIDDRVQLRGCGDELTVDLDEDVAADLVALALRLAHTPCGPLNKRHISPDRELAALLSQRPKA